MSEDKQDSGISAYDVDSPKSSRQGMPSRVLGKDRTRFTGGGFTQADLDLLKSHKYKASEVAKENEKFKISWNKSGCTLPYMWFNLLPLSVIPNFRITNKVLVDVNSMKLLPLFE